MAVQKPQNATTIDTISEGYAAINRRPWLLLVPVVLNLYLWFGLQVSFAPLTNTFFSGLEQLQQGGENQELIQAQYEQWRLIGQADAQRQFAVFNLVPLLTGYVVTGLNTTSAPVDTQVPLLFQSLSERLMLALTSALSGRVVEPVLQPLDTGRAVVEVANGPTGLLLFLVINTVALAISSVFLTQAAAAVRGDISVPGTGLRRVGQAALALIGYMGLVVGISIALGLPFVFFIGLLALVNPSLAGLGLSLLLVVAFWGSIYLSFAREAIVVSGIGPLRAIHASFNIVRRNFWGTLWFLILTLLVTVGSGLIWQSLIGSMAGLLVAIIGSAYVGSGLLAARMAFYRERLRRWQMVAVETRGQPSSR